MLTTPIHIVVVDQRRRQAGDGASAHLIVAGANSQASVAQTFVGAAGDVYFTNAVTEVVVGEGAIVEALHRSARVGHGVPRRQHPGARAAPRACSESHAFALGGRIMRNDIGTCSAARAPTAPWTASISPTASGWSTTTPRSITRCRTAPATRSTRASWPARRKAVFNGRIIVRLDAQKTDAKQTNRALLLSDEAPINSNPQLEIFADDVKCTHGAAVGQLDEEAMFYLQARGLNRAEARDMLLHAFAGEVIQGLKIPAAARADRNQLLQRAAQRTSADGDRHH